MAMNTKKWWLLAIGTSLVLASCGEGTEVEGPTTDNSAVFAPPLESLDTLLDGAPENASLQNEAKGDEVFEPTNYELLALQSPTANQGSRGVCSIFAAVALMEHLYIKEGTFPDKDFSEQYLQWSAKFEVNSFPNTSGSSSTYNLRAISDFGIVEEAFWPYESRPWGASNDERCAGDEAERPTECHTNGHPPQEAVDAEKWKLPSSRWISTRERDIKAIMKNKGTAVVAGGDFYYQSWNHGASSLPTNREYARKGYVLYPNEADKTDSRARRAGHAFLLVGWDDTLTVERLDEKGEVMLDENGEPMTESGFFIFKNSWGTGSWGTDHADERVPDGYGYISYRYVEEFLSARATDLPVFEEPEPEPEPVCGDTLSCADDACIDSPLCEGEPATFSSDAELAIPDDDANGVLSTIEVTGQGPALEVSVDVLVAHSFIGDLEVRLIHPNGDSIVLRQADGAAGEDFFESYQADAFVGLEAAGSWSLQVIDAFGADTGSLLGWDLTLVR
ncbi:proprotein convertase P-domain-containing protein [Lujinxingia sediminis]|nr:proprotein convertase P-domain-containing protein [Lujinxingia sediminis]